MVEINPFTAKTKFYAGENFVIKNDCQKAIVETQSRIGQMNGSVDLAWYKLISDYAIQKNQTYKIRFFEAEQ